MNKMLLAAALSLGALITWVDTRPTWDDTGITVAVILLGCGILGALGPKRPWLWALAVGVWIPLVEGALRGQFASVAALVVAFVGAYAGSGVRRAAGRRISG